MNSEMIDSATGLPLLRKRASETRLFAVDVKGRLTPGAEISSISSLVATALGRINNADELAISSASFDGTVVEFYAADGSAGETYRIVGVVTSGGQTIETRIAITVDA